MRIKKFLILIISTWLLVNFLAGCATAPVSAPTASLPSYDINGTSYFPLVSLCNARNINLQYDTFTRSAVLSRDSLKVNLRSGDNLVLVNGRPQHIDFPIEFYRGTIAAPYKFKEQVLDVVYKEQPLIVAKRIFKPIKIKKVVIDAGHGGNDPGAIGRTGTREKDINLDITKRLKSILVSEGIEVELTRSSDIFIPLPERVEIANDSGADLFVSIHSNANRVRKLNGFEVYYVGQNVDDSKRALQSAKSASLRLHNAAIVSNSLDLKATLWDMVYTNSRAESIELANAICRSMDENSNTRIIGVKSARFEVLRGVYMPAILVEAGFLSNPDEERLLKNSYYRQKVAELIAQGIRDYAQDTQLLEVAKR